MDELSLFLIQLADAKVQMESPIDKYPRSMVVNKLRNNGLSSEIFDVNSEDRSGREKRFKTLLNINKIFMENNIEYVMIKELNHPFTRMEDVDFLIAEPYDILRATQLLSQNGYKLYKFRLLAHPLKIMARKSDGPSIDIYPDAIWIRKKVSNGREIISRRRPNMNNIYVPSIEDDLHLVATHAYFHLNIKLAELLHCITLISNKKFDYDYLFEISKKFGTLDAVYLILLLIQKYSKAFYKKDLLREEYLERFRKYLICKIVGLWFQERQLRFPFKISLWIANLLSSFYHTPKLIANARVKELINDFLTHYLSISSKILMGKT